MEKGPRTQYKRFTTNRSGRRVLLLLYADCRLPDFHPLTSLLSIRTNQALVLDSSKRQSGETFIGLLPNQRLRLFLQGQHLRSAKSIVSLSLHRRDKTCAGGGKPSKNHIPDTDTAYSRRTITILSILLPRRWSCIFFFRSSTVQFFFLHGFFGLEGC